MRLSNSDMGLEDRSASIYYTRSLRYPNSDAESDTLPIWIHDRDETFYYTHLICRPRELVNLHQFSIAPPTTRSPITPSTSRASSRPTISIPRTPVTTMMTPWLLDHDHVWSHPESWTDHTHTHTHAHRADDDRWSSRYDDRLVVSGTAEALFQHGS